MCCVRNVLRKNVCSIKGASTFLKPHRVEAGIVGQGVMWVA